MAGVEKKSFDSPDEVRTPDKTKVSLVNLGDTAVGRAVFQPGWRWSECIKPMVGGDSCQATHLGVLISGRMAIVHDDGTEMEMGPGEPYRILPGHDGWVVGDEPAVAYEFNSTTATNFAKS
jgi:hypothetical protein